MLSSMLARARMWFQVAVAATGLAALGSTALAYNTSTAGPNPQTVTVGDLGGVVGVTYSSSTGEVWPPGATIQWSIINATGGAGVNTSYGNPCGNSTGQTTVDSNYASSVCSIRATLTPGTFKIQATSSVPATSTVTFDVTVVPPTITLSPTTLADGTLGAAYSQQLSASGGTSPYTYALTGGSLPANLSLTAAGALQGSPAQTGNFNFTVTATDSSGGSGPYTGARAYTLTVLPAPTPLPDPQASVNDVTITEGNSGTKTATFTVTLSAPKAQTVSVAYGTADGSATTADGDYVAAGGAVTFAPNETSKTFTVTINGDTKLEPNETFFVNLSNPNGATIADGQGVGTITNDDTQPLLSINNVSQNEGNAGTTSFIFTVQLSDPAPAGGVTFDIATADGTATAPSDYTAKSLTSQTIPAGSSTYSFTVLANGDTVFEVSETFLVNVSNATGASIADSQAVGTILNDDIAPPVANAISVTVAFNSTANNIPLNITGGAPTSVAVGVAATHGVATASGTSISYTPTTGYSGGDSFTYTATNAAGTSAPATVSITVSPPPPVTLSPATIPAGQVGAAYSQQLSAAGGVGGPYTFAVSAGALPAGLSLSASGALTGTPTAGGAFSFTAEATDSHGNTGSKAFALTVGGPSLVIAPTTLPGGTIGAVYPAQNITASGGTAPYSYAVNGTLPAGLSLSASGALTGTPTTGGTFGFGVTANDSSTGSGPFAIQRTYTVTISAPTIALAPVTLPNGTVGLAYSQQISASGGTGPYTYAVTAGSLPAGLSLNAAGALTGTPTTLGSSNVTVTATDSFSSTGSRAYTIAIAAPTITLAPATLADGTVGLAYSQQIAASGGTAPYTYAVTAGALPAGVSLTSTGLLAGTPTTPGTANFTVQATDGFGSTGSLAYALVINAPTITLAPATLADGTVGLAYSQQIAASGGTGPYTYALLSGTLPTGVSLTSAGLLAGTPTTPGTANFTVQATDDFGSTGSLAYALVINAPTITLAPATLADGTVGLAYSQQIAASGGTAPYTYAVTAGALPAGVSLSSTGLLAGTPTTPSTANFTVQATDGFGSTGSLAYALVINAPTITLAPATLADGTVGLAYSQQIAASGGTAPYTYAVTAGALPAGVSLSSTGLLAGTPATPATSNFTVQATDDFGSTGTLAYTLTIQQAAPTITAINPAAGPLTGGTIVTISGTDFTNVTSVTVDGAAASTFAVNSPTSITATTPAHAAGVVDVAVTTLGGTATATNAFTYQAPGAARIVVNSPDDGSYVFTSATPGLNFTITTSGGSGSSGDIPLAPGNYAVSFTTPSGSAIADASCAPSTSTVNTTAQTASLVVTSNVTLVCALNVLPSRRATVETLGAALDASSRLIIANAPNISRRIERLNGGGGSGGSASAFGKTFAGNLPFSADIGANTARFSASLSGLRKLGNDDHRFAPANENGVPASLAASVTPASGLAATAAADAAAAMTNRTGPRFDVWVEGLIAEFDAAANSDGHFAILHAGADYLVTDNILVGVGLQADWLDMNTATGSLDSTGWLAGPYLTARLADNLYLDARAAWGKASFDVSPFGTYTDNVASDRELYSAALIGQFEMGNLTIRPEGRVTWYKETTGSYLDSLAVFIPELEITTGEVSLGPDLEWTLPQANGGVFMPKIGFDLVWTFQQDNTATQFTGAPGLNDTGIRGRVEGGFSYLDPRGVTFGTSVFYDGIGGGDYAAWGGSLKVNFGF